MKFYGTLFTVGGVMFIFGGGGFAVWYFLVASVYGLWLSVAFIIATAIVIVPTILYIVIVYLIDKHESKAIAAKLNAEQADFVSEDHDNFYHSNYTPRH